MALHWTLRTGSYCNPLNFTPRRLFHVASGNTCQVCFDNEILFVMSRSYEPFSLEQLPHRQVSIVCLALLSNCIRKSQLVVLRTDTAVSGSRQSQIAINLLAHVLFWLHMTNVHPVG
jgi:hypothetical protein